MNSSRRIAPELLAAIHANSASALANYLDTQKSDECFDDKYLGMTAIQLICMNGSWECLMQVFRFYRRIGMPQVLRHGATFAVLWRRGYRDPVFSLVRMGLDPCIFLEMIGSESDFEALLRCVHNRPTFIRSFQQITQRRRIPCPWLGKYIALMPTQCPPSKN